MLPLFSPAISVVVYIFGNMLCAANASESNSPPLTRSRTLSSTAFSEASFCRFNKQFKGGENRQPGMNQGEELLVENQKRTLPDAPAAALARAEHPARLHPVNQVTLLRDPFPHLIYRVPVFELLGEMPALVCYFYEEFRHAVTSYLLPLYAKSNIPEMLEVANLITLKDLSDRTLICLPVRPSAPFATKIIRPLSVRCVNSFKVHSFIAQAHRR